MNDEAKTTGYGLETQREQRSMTVPQLDYKPRRPQRYRPRIGMIGCGGITEQHLVAYARDDYEIVAFCDVHKDAATRRRDAFAPSASVYTDYRDLLARDDIDVIDAATHPEARFAIIEDALNAGKHVLSQKPFVLDLDLGRQLVDLADSKDLRLAVNQNGRWAPYLRYINQAVRSGILGDPFTYDAIMQWDHTWTKGTHFETIHHLLLYDFAVHWFDAAIAMFPGRKALKVYATARHAPNQPVRPPMLANASIEFEGALATLSFSALNRFGGSLETNTVVGSRGTARSSGELCEASSVSLWTDRGSCEVMLEGAWMPDGMRGTMGELLCAIEEDREPENSARQNLRSLELVFAAIHSANIGQPVTPGSVLRLE